MSPKPATINRNGGKPPNGYKPARTLPVAEMSSERRAMSLALEYRLNGESKAWLAASDEDRAAAMALIEHNAE